MQARREVCIAVEGFLLEGLRWGYAAYLVEGISVSHYIAIMNDCKLDTLPPCLKSSHVLPHNPTLRP